MIDIILLTSQVILFACPANVKQTCSYLSHEQNIEFTAPGGKIRYVMVITAVSYAISLF